LLPPPTLRAASPTGPAPSTGSASSLAPSPARSTMPCSVSASSCGMELPACFPCVKANVEPPAARASALLLLPSRGAPVANSALDPSCADTLAVSHASDCDSDAFTTPAPFGRDSAGEPAEAAAPSRSSSAWLGSSVRILAAAIGIGTASAADDATAS
jgi:hypothetical protein